MRRCTNLWPGGTIVLHSLSQPLRAASFLREGAGKRPPQCQSPARWMFCQRAGDFWGYFFHSTGYLRNRGVAGDFHRPYETQKFLHSTIHRTTLPQSRIRSTAPSGREPGKRPTMPITRPLMKYQRTGDFLWVLCGGGYILPFNRVLAKIPGYGRFSSPLRNSKDITFHHSTNDTPSVTPIRA